MSETAGRLKPLAVIICDDIRREVSGKDIYIGVYTADIVVPQIPFDLPIGLAVICEPVALGLTSLYMELVPPGAAGHFMIGVDVEVTVTNPSDDTSHQNLAIVLNGIPVKIAQEGDLVIKVRHADESDWILTRRAFVKHGVPPGPQVPKVLPSAPEPPS